LRLSDLTASLTIKKASGGDPEIAGITYDSRRCGRDSVFVAVSGSQADGHAFIDQAVGLGAKAVIVEKWQPALDRGVAQVLVRDARWALARAAAAFYGRPSHKLQLIGVTGTNGKTTTAYLLESIFRQAGFTTGLISTIEYRINGQRQAAERTTPESSDLQGILADMVEKGVQVAITEVSSHALELRRVDACRFSGRIFTNLSQDHLDFHHDFESYFLAKARLFLDVDFDGHRLINADDAYGRRLADMSGEGVKTFGVDRGDYRVTDVVPGRSEVAFALTSGASRLPLQSSLIGDFNLSNLAAAGAAALELGVPATDVAAGIRHLKTVPGRFESIDCGQDFHIIVDYAHTPDGLDKVLATARGLSSTGRLIAVFGCGGDRDRGKRPQMGRIAARHADRIVVTSDNPRTEPPMAIIEEILTGVSARGECEVEIEREAAIRLALGGARAGDVVVIAGKGHEDRQILGDRAVPFDDRLVALKILEELQSDNR
jgi:UDP-N-acetylmuramoyl-L-alanyl-D-glutamate--2,6-diaminopimelate ligase